MSRVANNPINVPDNVEITISNDLVSVKGPLGHLSQHLTGDVKIVQNESILTFAATKET